MKRHAIAVSALTSVGMDCRSSNTLFLFADHANSLIQGACHKAFNRLILRACAVLSVGTKLSRDRLPHLLTRSFCSSAATVLDSELLGS